MASSTGSGTTKSKRSKVSPAIMELLDIAIFQFASLSGLRLSHKLRGDPVLEGVSAVFAQLISCSKAAVKSELESNASRLGNWKPGLEATKELKVLITGQIRQKKNFSIREYVEPAIPPALVLEESYFDEHTDRVVVKARHSRCWRCKEICRFCRNKVGLSEGFYPDLMAPLLEAVCDESEGEIDEEERDKEEMKEEEMEEEEMDEELMDEEESLVDEEEEASLYDDFKNQRDFEDEDDSGTEEENDSEEQRSEEEDIEE